MQLMKVFRKAIEKPTIIEISPVIALEAMARASFSRNHALWYSVYSPMIPTRPIVEDECQQKVLF